MAGLFVIYEPTEGGLGRITSSATVIDQTSYARDLTAAGKLFHFVPLDGFSGYFVLDPVTGKPSDMHTRPAFAGALDKSEVAMGEIATIPAVPACLVRFNGPSLVREHQHPGGALKMNFVLPGTYTIAFEAFPFLPVELKLTVKSPLAS